MVGMKVEINDTEVSSPVNRMELLRTHSGRNSARICLQVCVRPKKFQKRVAYGFGTAFRSNASPSGVFGVPAAMAKSYIRFRISWIYSVRTTTILMSVPTCRVFKEVVKALGVPCCWCHLAGNG